MLINPLKKSLLIALLLSVFAFSSTGYAQDLKVGVVKPDKLLDESAQAKKALKKLETEFAVRDKKIIAEGLPHQKQGKQ